MDKNKLQLKSRKTRHKRIRAKVSGTSERPRFSVFRSNKYISVQIIDDSKGQSLLQINDTKLDKNKTTKMVKAFELGKKVAEAAKQKKIKKVVFDRGGYKFHGRIKAVADGAREGGLEF